MTGDGADIGWPPAIAPRASRNSQEGRIGGPVSVVSPARGATIPNPSVALCRPNPMTSKVTSAIPPLAAPVGAADRGRDRAAQLRPGPRDRPIRADQPASRASRVRRRASGSPGGHRPGFELGLRVGGALDGPTPPLLIGNQAEQSHDKTADEQPALAHHCRQAAVPVVDLGKGGADLPHAADVTAGSATSTSQHKALYATRIRPTGVSQPPRRVHLGATVKSGRSRGPYLRRGSSRWSCQSVIVGAFGSRPCWRRQF